MHEKTSYLLKTGKGQKRIKEQNLLLVCFCTENSDSGIRTVPIRT